ncbi:hypothetical protein L2E82_49911 [Cichorium intybus]|uniref:Uncharacterized protein n=1 Tax=Cichorium intybus TaxID=13427 RepID=A0ACB8Z260_CICIN|nr:hypothetical protein L2E82_49911 [Cichorium intybus]
MLDDTPQYEARRDELSSRPVLAVVQLDWALLTQAGLWAELQPFIQHTWADGEHTFTCHGWDRLMANEEDVVYKELLLEFLSTCRYTLASRESQPQMIRFRLAGESRECNLREFGRRTGIYTEAELHSRHFVPFLRACIKGQPQRDANVVIWAAMSNDLFEAGLARESQLRDPLHRLMHRIISTSVM